MFFRHRLACSFCGKEAAEVSKLVAGPRRVFICDGCVAIASRIMSEADGDTPPQSVPPLSFRSRVARWLGRAFGSLERAHTG